MLGARQIIDEFDYGVGCRGGGPAHDVIDHRDFEILPISDDDAFKITIINRVVDDYEFVLSPLALLNENTLRSLYGNRYEKN